ncbi:replication initiator protein [Dipodfec virus UA06Rod_4]|uniref:Replication initiator protein n=1 Tax=Dipodfec virus UA06Rod_4 TaxID=2929324 RepID=A0A976N2E0_9VIRU|nr:replication initiator protein [Dipodfec virus UA06Rod_4]
MAAPVVPLDLCLNPVRVSTNGTVSYYRCGHCSNCKRSYVSRWRNRLVSHMESGLFTTLFITLTYSNEHLPLVHLSEDGTISDITHTRFLRGGFSKGNYVRESVFDSDFFLRFPDLNNVVINDFPHWVSSRTADSVIFDHSDSFAICLRADIQNFVKKLRRLISDKFDCTVEDTSLGYFICSEYGPTTFRPHYHGLLFLRSSRVAEFCNNSAVFEAWGKQSLPTDNTKSECSKYVNSSGIASYVSKYVTCFDSLPSPLSLPAFQPFHLQSTRVPIGSLCAPASVAFDSVDKNSLFHLREYFDKSTREFVSVKSPYPLSFWNKYFPHLPFNNQFSSSEVLDIFRICYCLRDSKTIPDYRSELISMGLGSIRTNKIRFYLDSLVVYERHNFAALDEIIYLPTVDGIFKSLGLARPWRENPRVCLTSESVYKLTPSLFFHLHHGKIPLIKLLFGIPALRCFCNKIISNFRDSSLPWTTSVFDYYSYFCRYETCSFSARMALLYDTENRLYNSESFTYSPSLVAHLYPSFVETLPKNLSLMTPDEILYLDTYVYENFRLSISDFYIDDSLCCSKMVDTALNDYTLDTRRFITKFKAVRKQKHDLSLCS